MALSLMKGKRVTLSKVDAFADGVAVKQASRILPDTPCRHSHLGCLKQIASQSQPCQMSS